MNSWTQFHQDGNGTVDSGHQCLAGRNRVIMLRRLENETDKRVALRILSGSADNDGGDGVMMGGDSESESDGHGNVDGMGRDGAGDNVSLAWSVGVESVGVKFCQAWASGIVKAAGLLLVPLYQYQDGNFVKLGLVVF